MKVSVSQEVFDQFPAFARGVVIVRNADNKTVVEDVEQNLHDALISVQRIFQEKNLTTHPHIANWRMAYRTLGVKAGDYYSSVESLARRARIGKSIPYVNTLVAIMNIFSLVHLVPCGGDDLDKISEDIVLKRAIGDETFTAFDQSTREKPDASEIIYVDSGTNDILCRRWNWRQGERTKITYLTRNALINIDCLPPIDKNTAQQLSVEICEQIRVFCNAQVEYAIIDTNNMELAIE
jgi:lysyl-tRNA synthetase class 2